MSGAMDRYMNHVITSLGTVFQEERESIEHAAALIARAVAEGGIVHTFGSGHSSLVAQEVVGRSGHFVPINQIVDRTEDLAERLEGYGRTLVEFYHQQYGLKPGEVVVVISNSGINPLPIEIAMEARARGLGVIAITNLRQSQTADSRHSSGRRLFEIADVVLDNHGVPGEAVVSVSEGRVGTEATLTGVLLINLVMVRAAELLYEEGITPRLFVSENDGSAQIDERNASLRRLYQGRLRRAGV